MTQGQLNEGQLQLDAFILAIKGKTVSLLGNAASLYSRPVLREEIEKSDIVVRMNRGVILTNDRLNYTGTRCEVYCASGSGLVHHSKFTTSLPKHSIYMTTYSRETAPPHFAFYPEDWWLALRLRLEDASDKSPTRFPRRPSTGLMVFDLFYSHTEFKHLSLFGYDFWKTPTFYTNGFQARTHDPSAERNLILSALVTDERLIKF